MRRLGPFALVALFLALLALGPLPSWAGGDESFAFFHPTVRLSGDDWRNLRAGRMIVRTLPATRSDHTAIFVASHLDVTPEQFVERVRRSAELWRGPKVPASETFSRPVEPANVRNLFLRADDLGAVRSCRPGNCALKLAVSEMERLRGVALNGDDGGPAAVQQEFRDVVLDRMRAYHREGLRGLPSPHDHSTVVDLQEAFSRLLEAAPFLTREASAVAEYVASYPAAPLPPGAEDFAYWLETSETPRPTIQSLHVTLTRRPPSDPVEVVVVSRQVFATHYLNGSLAVTALLRDPADPTRRYLAYVNVAATDGLGGFFSGIKRFFVERRIRGAARSAFGLFKDRLEA